MALAVCSVITRVIYDFSRGLGATAHPTPAGFMTQKGKGSLYIYSSMYLVTLIKYTISRGPVMQQLVSETNIMQLAV